MESNVLLLKESMIQPILENIYNRLLTEIEKTRCEISCVYTDTLFERQQTKATQFLIEMKKNDSKTSFCNTFNFYAKQR